VKMGLALCFRAETEQSSHKEKAKRLIVLGEVIVSMTAVAENATFGPPEDLAQSLTAKA